MERPKGKFLPLFGDITKVDLFRDWCETNFTHPFTFEAYPFSFYGFASKGAEGFDVLVDGHADDLRLLEWGQAE
jgi:hypothetical protein